MIWRLEGTRNRGESGRVAGMCRDLSSDEPAPVGVTAVRRSGGGSEVVGPLLDDDAAAFGQVGEPVGGLGAVVVDVRQDKLAASCGASGHSAAQSGERERDPSLNALTRAQFGGVRPGRGSR